MERHRGRGWGDMNTLSLKTDDERKKKKERKKKRAPAGVAQWVECWPVD